MNNNFHLNTVYDFYKKKNLEIIKSNFYTEWDGADSYGKKSVIYDLIIEYKENNILKIDLWNREEFHGDKKDPYIKNKTYESKEKFIDSNFYKHKFKNNTIYI